MRIISGHLGGRRLTVPQKGTRPTSDRVKESLFAILGEPAEEYEVLDLFAGSGALGLEALSRGAKSATFVDQGSAAIRSIKDNVRSLGVGDRTTVLAGDVKKVLLRLGNLAAFQWIFIDPPYKTELAETPLQALGACSTLLATVKIIVEHDRRNELQKEYIHLCTYDSRRYGDTMLTFYGKK